mgnify:CR=1 FL=1
MKAHNKETQSQMTPRKALQFLQEGNERFINNLKANRNLLEQANETRDGQWPFATILSCIDSRTSAELIFDQGLGDIFSVRIAGNIVNTDILGSMEFACKVAGAKLIIIMGHQHCGAVIGAIDDVKLGNLTTTLSKIKPAIRMSQNYKGNMTSKNEEFVKIVSENNVRHAISTIRSKSPILKEMEENGEIKIVGLFYTLTKGELIFVD